MNGADLNGMCQFKIPAYAIPVGPMCCKTAPCKLPINNLNY